MKRGFSLIEAMITFFLVFLILGVALQLLSEYSTAINFTTSKDNSLSVAQRTLQQIVDEVRQSQTLESPAATGVPTMDLRFRRTDPNATWLPSTPPTSWVAWSYLDYHQQLEVQYRLSNGQLFRDVSTPTNYAPTTSTPSSTAVVADSLAGFQTELLASGLVQVQLTVRESSQYLVLTSTVLRPCP